MAISIASLTTPESKAKWSIRSKAKAQDNYKWAPEDSTGSIAARLAHPGVYAPLLSLSFLMRTLRVVGSIPSKCALRPGRRSCL
jgi:hypothetical protein